MRTARIALLIATATLSAGLASRLSAAHDAGAPVAPQAVMEDPNQARVDYIENCGGCHGVNGSTVPAQLPELMGRVGWFMCTPESRAYLIRLPNVAHSHLHDNAELADLMNYVVFVLGGNSVPAGTKPFTAQEVGRERLHALSNASLTDERLRHATAAVKQCHAPEDIKLLYPGYDPATAH
ncbi:MAG TPA: cytochrome C [Novosphingobium capsulatum]|nr:cytochrome C [Novosphingobium capsulatum]